MKILSCDPATHFGWAFHNGEQITTFGTWNLSVRRHESQGMRMVKAQKSLRDVIESLRPELVVYEEVARHVGTQAAHVYGGLVAVIQTVCIENDLDYVGIPVGTIKKHATGKGNAKKDLMLSTAQDNWPNLNIVNDNEADAMWLADLAAKEYGS